MVTLLTLWCPLPFIFTTLWCPLPFISIGAFSTTSYSNKRP